jgi:DNA-directed RNA polymerase specialized sigma24 family protein
MALEMAQLPESFEDVLAAGQQDEESLELDPFDPFDTLLMETSTHTGLLETSNELDALPAFDSKEQTSLNAPGPLEEGVQTHHDTTYAARHQRSQELERALIERARQGSQTARDELVVSLLPHVARYAIRYFQAHGWQTCGGVSVDDLVSEASLRMLERFGMGLTADNPCAYLLASAYRVIRETLWHQASPIHTPRTPGAKPKVVMSLDAPLPVDCDETMLDKVAARGLGPSPSPEGLRDFSSLYQAALSLSESERAVLAVWYDLPQIAPASLESILARLGRTGIDSYKSRILTRLYRLLAPRYPQYGQEVYVQEYRPSAANTQVCLSQSQKQRLDAAYTQLQQDGQKISGQALSQLAHVDYYVARLYLDQRHDIEEDPTSPEGRTRP